MTPTSPTAHGPGRAAAPAALLSAPWLLAPDLSPLREGAVVVDDADRIVAIDARASLRATHPSLPERRGAGILMPGLVNAHTHLDLSALAGAVPGGAGLVAWADEVARRLPGIAPGARRVAAVETAHAAVAAGTAAVGDVSNDLACVPALAAAGLRGIVFHELLGSRDARSGDALLDAENDRRASVAQQDWPDGVGYVPAPHAPYSADPALLRRIFMAAAAAGGPSSIHVAEDPDELALLRHGAGAWAPVLRALGADPAARRAGTSPLPLLAACGAFAARRPPLLVHMVHADATDRAIARDRDATAVLCPRSNLHIGGRLPDAPALLADGVRLAIGTDSLASTPDLSLWGEIAALARAFPDVPASAWLAAATSDSAAALGLANLGSLTPGKRPGVIDVVPAELRDDPLGALMRDPTPRVAWMARA